MEPLEFTDLIRLTVAIVLHDQEALVEIGDKLKRIGHAEPIHETVLQCHLFCGFPRTLAALDVLREAGLKVADPGFAAPEEAKGQGLFDTIYGDGAGRVRKHLETLSPTFAGWIANHAYGAVLARPGLSPMERECLAVAALAATGHGRQLASHARGAVRCGARPEDVKMTVETLEGRILPERLERAREIVSRFAEYD